MKHRLYAAETNGGLSAFTAAEMVLIDQAARNLMDTYDSASESVKAAGASWYSGKAAALAQSVADECGIEFETAAAVIAVCSPRTRWAQQVANTTAFCQHILGGGWPQGAPKASLYYASMERAAAILRWGDMSALSGPKVTPFYRNIIGDESVVTLDVWAIRAACARDDMSEDEINAWTRGRRRLVLEAAYHRAARHYGESPAALQAVVWVVVRGAAD